MILWITELFIGHAISVEISLFIRFRFFQIQQILYIFLPRERILFSKKIIPKGKLFLFSYDIGLIFIYPDVALISKETERKREIFFIADLRRVNFSFFYESFLREIERKAF